MQGVLLPVWLSSGIGLTILLAFSWVHFRHLGLALLATFAPLPGIAAVTFGVDVPAGAEMPGYLCGFVVAGFLASGIDARIADGDSAGEAARTTYFPRSFPLGLSLLLCVVAPLFAALNLSSLQTGAAVAAPGASAFLFMPLGARLFTYGEDFISRAARLRETRERWLDSLTLVVQPRWAWSVSGIGLIFGVLGFFGNSLLASEVFVLGAATAAATIVAGVVIRDVRRTTAFFLTFVVLMLATSWICARLSMAASASGPREMLLTGMLSSMPVLLAAAQISAFARSGDTVSVAILRMFEESAVPILFIVAGLAAAALASLTAEGPFVAILVLSGGAAALVVMPALMIALYDLFPPLVSLDAYRVR